MKKILGLVLSFTAFGATDPLEFGKYYEGRNPESVNYIKNSSCFKGVANITGTNTTPSKNTTTPLTSYSDCQSTLDSATDTVEWSANTLDRSLKNGNCEVGIRYKLTLGSGNTIQLQARINSATVASADLVTSDNGTATVNFPCGDLSNAPSLRIAQTAGSSSQAINVANVYLGAARNIGTVAQASFVGSISWAKTTNCQWTTTQSTYAANFTADTDCDDNARTVEGSVTDSSSGQSPQFGIPNMAPGYYMITVTGTLVAYDGSGTAARTEFQLSDGSQVGNEVSVATAGAAAGSGDLAGTGTNTFFVTVNTAQSPTYNIRGKTSVGTAPQAQIDVRYSKFKVSVYRFPSSSEIAVRNGTTPAWGSVRWANVASDPASTNSSWTTLSNAVLATRTNTGAATNPSSTSDAAVKIPSLPAGSYLVFASGSLATASGLCRWAIYDGTNRRGQHFQSANGGTTFGSPFAGGIFTYTSQSDQTFQLQTFSNGGTATCSMGVDSADKAIEITVIPISQQNPAPILVGSVTSNSTGAERVERATFNCTSSSSITSQSGSWISSPTNISSGACTATIASGIWSSVPSCVISQNESAATNTSWSAKAISTTSLGVGCSASGAACVNGGPVNVICMGAR